jgi:hypothetical protein
MVLGRGSRRKETNNVIIYHQNIRSLNKKQDEISICYKNVRIDHISYVSVNTI